MTASRQLSDRSGTLARSCASLLAALCLTGCAASVAQTNTATGTALTEQPPATAALSSGPVKIAMLLSLGGLGPSAAMSKAMKQAAELALFERDDPNIELVVKDDKGTAAGAAEAATLAVADGAEIIIGPLLYDAVPGAAQIAQQSNVPVLALSNNAAAAGPNTYLMSFLVEEEVERIVSYAAKQGKRHFAALIPETPYGRVVEAAFRQSVGRNGGSVRVLETYPANANGMIKPAKAVVAAIKRADEAGLPIEALFVPGGEETLPKLGPVLSYAGIDEGVQLLGTGAWDYPAVVRETVFHGGWFAGPDPGAFQGFSERFARTFGQKPPRIATLAYDAIGFAINLSAPPRGQRFTPERLTRPSGYVGIDGLIRLQPNGLPERGLAILEVQPYGLRTRETAPATTLQQVSSIAGALAN